jgi:disulfide bond formation protein DsbB
MVKKEYLLYLAWMISLLSTLGSLYFSEILHYAPCVLCWYQRIFMYPIPLILTVGIVKKDKFASLYVFLLSLFGWLIAFYHVLLYYGIIPETIAPCKLGVSCTTKFIEYFGFVTIPFLSLLAFSSIMLLMIVHRKGEEHK